MNITQQLNVKQETDRIQKGLDIFNANLIEQINQREYLVKNQYVVEDLTEIGDIEPYFTCSCKDYEMRKVECKHIHAIIFYQLSRIGA